MQARDSWQVGGGFWVTSLGTLVSRVLGLVRDMATAALLGLGEGSVMDALAIAFRVANLPRRLLGEGALATSFLPVFSDTWNRDPKRGWQLLSVLFTLLGGSLGVVVLAVALLCAAAPVDPASRELAGLTAAMLPYAIFMCVAAQAAAALQALFEFRWPALAPSLLNVCWLVAVWLVAPRFSGDLLSQAYVIAGAVVASGVLQLGLLWAALARRGFRFDFNWLAAREGVGQIVRSMAPVALALAVTQLNTLGDSAIAWLLSSPDPQSQRIGWLGDVVYPMQTGAAAAIYYGERFYQLPVALLGVAIATVIYPLLSRHAARGDRQQIGADLSLGLGLVWFTALPAGVGMMLVAPTVVPLLFERGAFSAEDAARAARMIACYASGVWAYSALPVLVRGFYAAGDRLTPARIGVLCVAVDLLLNLALVWPLAERGLAVSTSLAAALQVVLLAALFSRIISPLAWTHLRATLVRGSLATVAMAAAVLAVQFGWPPVESRHAAALELVTVIVCGVVAYLAAAWLLGVDEVRLLLRRRGGVPN